MKQLWMRTGDNADYESVESPREAGYNVGMFFKGKTKEELQPRWRPMGVEIGGFYGQNYISLFWGDKDAQPVGKASLTVPEQFMFLQGVLDGAGVPDEPRKVAVVKTRKSSKSHKRQSTLGSMR